MGPTSRDIKSLNPILALALILFSSACRRRHSLPNARAATASRTAAPPPPRGDSNGRATTAPRGLPRARAAGRCCPEGISDACAATVPRRLPTLAPLAAAAPTGFPKSVVGSRCLEGSRLPTPPSSQGGSPTSVPPAAPTPRRSPRPRWPERAHPRPRRPCPQGLPDSRDTAWSPPDLHKVPCFSLRISLSYLQSQSPSQICNIYVNVLQ